MPLGLAALLFALPAAADERERFTGKWILDIEASGLERSSVSSELDLEFLGNETNDIRMKARWLQNDGRVVKRDYTYVCDGKPQHIQETAEETRAANAVWQNGDLKIVSTMTVDSTEFTAETVWALTDENTLEFRNYVDHPTKKSRWKEIYRRKASK